MADIATFEWGRGGGGRSDFAKLYFDISVPNFTDFGINRRFNLI